VYVVAQGGNPGLSGSINNSAILLMAALGDCSNLSATNYFINVNEVTTAAAAWALAPFLAPGGVVGASSTNATGLRNAFINANKLVNIATGTAPGAALPGGVTTETAKLYTFANILSGCVNSDGTTACNPLFAAATVGASVPSNTLDAARNVVLNPANNVGSLFMAVPAHVAFASGLSGAPHDWTMSVTYTGGGLSDPADLALDSQGNVWVANFGYFPGGGAVTEISPAGKVQSLTDPSLEESFGIAIDGSNNVWVTNEQSASSVNSGAGSIAEFNSAGQVMTGSPYTAGGIDFPYAIAADTDGSVWVADYATSTATHLAANGSSLSGVSGYTSSDLDYVGSVALDAAHDAWFGRVEQNQVAEVTATGSTISAYSCGTACGSTESIAIDQAGDVWITDQEGSSVVELGSNGAKLQTLSGIGGIYTPQDLAIDGSGNVWLTNLDVPVSGQPYSISAITGANSGPTSTAISPASGFGMDAGMEGPHGIAIDSSGSVWVSDSSLNAVTQFVGLAAPVATPLLGPPKQP
jgi:streptogramin lyase